MNVYLIHLCRKNYKKQRNRFKDINIEDIVLQEEEVQDIKWFDKEEVIKKINNNYESLTDKVGCWNYLLKYFEINK